MASLSAVITNIYKTNWTNVNEFEVTFSYAGSVPDGATQSEATAMWERLDFYIVAVATPDITQSPIDTFYGDQWAMESGRREIQRTNVTFRDFVDGDDSFVVYKNIKRWLDVTKDWYTKEKTLAISIKQNGVVVFEGTKCFLESVSNISFNRETASQVGQFSATFKIDPDSTGSIQ